MKDRNFTMLKKLNEEFTPKSRGFITGEEVEQIKATLHLDEMDGLELRNLRDFTVMFFALRSIDNEESSDKKSGIIGVIDKVMWESGLEV